MDHLGPGAAVEAAGAYARRTASLDVASGGGVGGVPYTGTRKSARFLPAEVVRRLEKNLRR